MIGTPYYVAPEQLEKDCSDNKIESDMWAIGVTVYQLLTGKYPFDTKIGRDDLNGRIMSCNYGFPEDWSHGQDCKDFVERLLEPTVKNRLTPKAALAHPWLQWQAPLWNVKPEVIQRLKSYRKSNDFLFIC